MYTCRLMTVLKVARSKMEQTQTGPTERPARAHASAIPDPYRVSCSLLRIGPCKRRGIANTMWNS